MMKRSMAMAEAIAEDGNWQHLTRAIWQRPVM